MQEAVIVSAVRIPTGKFLGALKDMSATDLGALVVREAVTRAGVDPAAVDECIMGNVVSAGVGQAPARQAALKGGLPDSVAALTINKVCGSGLKAVMLATQGIQTGDIDDRGGRRHGVDEQLRPTCCPRCARGCAWATAQLIDSMIHDGLWCPFENWHMGNAGETVADAYQGHPRGAGRLRRRQPPEGRRGAGAPASSRTRFCRWPIPQRKGAPVDVRPATKPVRPDTTAETLRALKPAFKKDGTRHRRQRAAGQRRRRGAGRDVGGARAGARPPRRWRASWRRQRAGSSRRCC